jgi:hypothetical protein
VDQYRNVGILEVFLGVFLFFLLMSAVLILIRFFERRDRLIINNSEQKIGAEIDYGQHCKGLCYTLMIRKLNDTEWMAYKLFSSGSKLSLRRGDLRKIVGYLNRNFGYTDKVVDFD